MIRKGLRWIRQRWKLALAALGGLGLVGAIVFVIGVTVWEYTNSTAFCGTTCHTMPPEYVAYQQSPHARVSCVDCHLGQESVLRAIPRKAMEVRHVVFAVTQDYEVPIYVRSMRPARDTCEQCHDPEKSSLDSLKRITTFGPDIDNTERYTYLTLKTGGGAEREGEGRGIHWHTTNEVWFLANDELKQDIPYVKEVGLDGSIVEYFDLESGITPEMVAERADEMRRMDCIDCHNRVSHLFQTPENAIDEALANGLIDASLPYIKVRSQLVLTSHSGTAEDGLANIALLEAWYRNNWPDVYEEKQASIKQAVNELQRIFTEIYFPDMGVGWITHPDNVGHRDFPGCFRCHDGKHTSPAGQTIRLECNICHTIPRVSGPGLPAPIISVAPANEPASHRDSNWLARHRQEFDDTCAGCHSTFNRGGADDSSFCANSACHGVEWKWAGLDAPGLREILPPAGENQEDEGGAPPTQERDSFIPTIPHPLTEDRIGQCLNCHGLDGLAPYTPFHAEENFPLDACTQCHKLAPTLQENPDTAALH